MGPQVCTIREHERVTQKGSMRLRGSQKRWRTLLPTEEMRNPKNMQLNWHMTC